MVVMLVLLAEALEIDFSSIHVCMPLAVPASQLCMLVGVCMVFREWILAVQLVGCYFFAEAQL